MPPSDSTCWTLVRSAAAGSRVDRDDFVRRYSPVVTAYLAARWKIPPDHEEIVDATHEVFLQCFKEGGALERADPERPGGFRAFLFGITRNVAGGLESRRIRSRNEEDSGDQVCDVPTRDDTTSQVFDRAWARMIVREARELMERRCPQGRSLQGLEALRLRYEAGMKSGEIAQVMGVSPGTVYQLLSDARKEFRAALLEIMSEYHPGASRAEVERRCVESLQLL